MAAEGERQPFMGSGGEEEGPSRTCRPLASARRDKVVLCMLPSIGLVGLALCLSSRIVYGSPSSAAEVPGIRPQDISLFLDDRREASDVKALFTRTPTSVLSRSITRAKKAPNVPLRGLKTIEVPPEELKKLTDVFELSPMINICSSSFVTCAEDGTLEIGRKTDLKHGITDPSHCGFKQVSLSSFEGVKMTSVSSLNFDFLFDSDKMCQPAGNLSALMWFPNLRSLRLGRQVVGSVKDLLPLKKLESINLQGTFFSGVLDDLKPMASLKNLTISYTSIHGGDLKILQYMTRLQKLSLDYFPIHSPLNLIKHLKDLKHLRIRMCGVPGDLSDLEPLTQLEELNLQEIGGPLRGLRNMKNLKSITLKSKVDGYLSDLQGLSEVKHLDIAEGQVIGNLTDLRHMTKLEHLSLRGFNTLMGSTKDVVGMKQLKFLELPSSKLTGGIEDMWHLNHLERFAAGHVHFAPEKESQQSKADKSPIVATTAQPAVPPEEDRKLRDVFKLSQADNLCKVIGSHAPRAVLSQLGARALKQQGCRILVIAT